MQFACVFFCFFLRLWKIIFFLAIQIPLFLEWQFGNDVELPYLLSFISGCHEKCLVRGKCCHVRVAWEVPSLVSQ